MKKLEGLGKVLSKNDQRKIKGGVEDEVGGEGGCIRCTCLDNGYSSCWYTNDPWGLCPRVYPNCSFGIIESVPCTGCTMN